MDIAFPIGRTGSACRVSGERRIDGAPNTNMRRVAPHRARLVRLEDSARSRPPGSGRRHDPPPGKAQNPQQPSRRRYFVIARSASGLAVGWARYGSRYHIRLPHGRDAVSAREAKGPRVRSAPQKSGRGPQEPSIDRGPRPWVVVEAQQRTTPNEDAVSSAVELIGIAEALDVRSRLA